MSQKITSRNWLQYILGIFTTVDFAALTENGTCKECGRFKSNADRIHDSIKSLHRHYVTQHNAAYKAHMEQLDRHISTTLQAFSLIMLLIYVMFQRLCLDHVEEAKGQPACSHKNVATQTTRRQMSASLSSHSRARELAHLRPKLRKSKLQPEATLFVPMLKGRPS